MISSQAVVVANHTAGLRSVLVVVEDFVGQVSQLTKVLLDVQDVRVEIHVLIPERVTLYELLEPVHGHIILLRGVAHMSNLIHDVDAVRKVLKQSTIECDAFPLLLQIQEETSIVEVLHPVVS
jgi:hypothetical protein